MSIFSLTIRNPSQTKTNNRIMQNETYNFIHSCCCCQRVFLFHHVHLKHIGFCSMARGVFIIFNFCAGSDTYERRIQNALLNKGKIQRKLHIKMWSPELYSKQQYIDHSKLLPSRTTIESQHVNRK